MRALLVAAIFLVACRDAVVSRTIGARCDVTSDCDDRCLPPGEDFPGGFCTLDCLDARDCPGDAACIDREGGVCLLECVDDGDCAFLGEGWRCHEETPRPEGQTVKVCRGG